MSKKIRPGVWINAGIYGEAVCTGLLAEGWVAFRYEARRGSSGEGPALWVLNGVPMAECTFLRPIDRISRYVLTLQGPYGTPPEE